MRLSVIYNINSPKFEEHENKRRIIDSLLLLLFYRITEIHFLQVAV